MKTKLLAILLVFSLYAAAQSRDTLHGRIVVAEARAAGVFVINKNTGTEVKTDSKGEFFIPAKNGDRLTIYSNKTVMREFYISTDSFKNMPYEMAVDPQGYEIEEVVIDESITPESLGLVPEGQKRYTVAERRLKTATDLNPALIGGLGFVGMALSIDPLINAITGRTKMLKKELATERKLFGMENINNIYNEGQITAELGIPAEKVQGFLFYAVEDAELLRAIKNKNDSRAKLELSVLATKYLALQQEETETTQTAPAPATSTNIQGQPAPLQPQTSNEN